MSRKTEPPRRTDDEIECSSPPCYAHEVDPAYRDLDPDRDGPPLRKNRKNRGECGDDPPSS